MPLKVARIISRSSAVPILPSGPGQRTGIGVPAIWGGVVSASRSPWGYVIVAVKSFKVILLPSGAWLDMINITLKNWFKNAISLLKIKTPGILGTSPVVPSPVDGSSSSGSSSIKGTFSLPTGPLTVVNSAMPPWVGI